MEKSPDAFRTISEVADWLGIQAHVLRFWESKFTQVKPVKRAGGRRYYRPTDMQLLGGIKKLLHEDGMTIKGVQKILREQGVGHVSTMSQPLEESATEAAAGPRRVQKVVPLQRRSANVDQPSETPDHETRSDAQIELTLEPAEQQSPAQTREAEVSAEPAPEPQAPEAPPAEAELAPETEPASELPPSAEPPADPELEKAETMPLPRFQRRSGKQVRSRDETPGEPAGGEPELSQARTARVVDAPDPPPEAEIQATPGLLTRLATLDRLSKSQAAKIAPLVRALAATRNAPETAQKNA